jgi:uncharacterized protein (DUF2225 family)
MTKEKVIDHSYTEDIVCPHCGYKFSDSYEFDSDSGELNCYECEKDFFFERNRSVNYTTSKIES